MAQASEHLLEMMDKYPEVKRLADNKVALRQALLDKGFTEEQVEDMSGYADLLKTLDFSIDQVIEQNGYTHNFGTEENPVTLSSVLADELSFHETAMPSITEYGNGENQFYKEGRLTYLAVKPCVGDMYKFCFGASHLQFIPQMDWSKVTKISTTFGNNAKQTMYVHDTYTIDCSSMTAINALAANFTRELVFTNMSDTCSTGNLLNGTRINPDITKFLTLESVVGLNLSAMTVNGLSYNANYANNVNSQIYCVPHIELAEGSIIRTANVITGKYSDPGKEDTTTDGWDTETLYGFLTHAYDWTTNPRGLDKPETAKDAHNAVVTLYYNYRLTTAAKARLEAAYPDVDFTTLMSSKGWEY